MPEDNQAQPQQQPLSISPVLIEDEMRKSYLDYSMSMITARALPDVRDGLKPVHRRVLMGLEDIGLQHNKPTKKCANVVGHVMAKYHPHGDMAIYDTLVRMAQDFSLRYPMVEGQGNFGSIDGDPPAAYRYTECRMTALAEDMLADIDKDTVDFVPNYDDSLKEPSVLPAKLPFLLLNGSTGIAVGMATNMAPHNMNEVVDGIVACIDNPDLGVLDLINIIPGPDFPTGGVIYGKNGILAAYKTGNGRLIVRAKAEVEKEGDREQIVVTEIPYMVNKSALLERMAELVREKALDGVSFLRDESDRSGMRIVIGVKKESFADVVLNQLYKFTSLQDTFAVNNLALVNKQPRQLPLKDLIMHFIDHRHAVVTRRTQYDLARAQERAHILEGLKIAIDNIDEIVALIKASPSTDEAQHQLMERFKFSEAQAHAILEMKLARLTGLERGKIESELAELARLIAEYSAILASRERRMAIIKTELLDLKQRFGDARRTQIVDASDEDMDIDMEDMIPDEDMVVTMSHAGYIKRCAATAYRTQGRGGKGVIGMESKDDDFVETLFVASAHTHILFFTTAGRCYWLKVYKIPEAGRQSRGKPIVNLLSLRPEEKIAAFVPVKEFDESHFIITATERGVVNKQPLLSYSNVRKDGINAMHLDEGDRMIECKLTNGNNDVILGTASGQAVRFHESAARELGRNTRGVRGVKLVGDDRVVSMVIVDESNQLLTVTENGFGKRTPVAEYRKTNRGGSGIINIKTSERNGSVVALKRVSDKHDIMLITKNGIIIRCDVGRISVIGRNTQGVRLINLDEGDKVVDVAIVEKQAEADNASPAQANGIPQAPFNGNAAAQAERHGTANTPEA
ncbi:MAG TPA: DNA gyrase subunit A [Chitinivibrionales bacterium]|nr:DNA gyrase subunit A [Chitinivibrionales bacterium]